MDFGAKVNSELRTIPELFLGKGVLKIIGKFTGEHPCSSAISIKLPSNIAFFPIYIHNNFFFMVQL